MPFISASYPHWSNSQYSLCVCLALVLSYTLAVALDQMQRCAELQSDSQSASACDYCVDERLAKRDWFQAMGECRKLGGELVSLERPKDIEDIRELLSGRRVQLSNGVFVNAHRWLYSVTGFAWPSGKKLQTQPLLEEVNSFQECVKYFSTEFWPIGCNSDFHVFPLVCQRDSPRKTPDMKSSMLAAWDLNAAKWIQLNHINYTEECCDYSYIVRFDYTWYQAKQLCENINGELLGMPRNEECRLIDAILTKRVKEKYPELFLNVHAKMYSRNDSYETFRDFSGKTFKNSECVWSNTLKYEENDKEEYCVVVKQNKTLSQHKCKQEDPSGLKAIICIQYRLNTYPYEKRTRNNSSTPNTHLHPPSNASHPVSLTPNSFNDIYLGLFMGIMIVLSVAIILGLCGVLIYCYCWLPNHGKESIAQPPQQPKPLSECQTSSTSDPQAPSHSQRLHFRLGVLALEESTTKEEDSGDSETFLKGSHNTSGSTPSSPIFAQTDSFICS